MADLFDELHPGQSQETANHFVTATKMNQLIYTKKGQIKRSKTSTEKISF